MKMAFLKDATIFRKMVGIFLVIAVGIGAMSVISLNFFYTRSDRASTAHSVADQIDFWMLQARRNEKDSQLRDIRLIQFYKDGSGVNIAKHAVSVAGMYSSIDELSRLHQIKDVSLIGHLRTAVKGYNAAFAKLMTAYRLKGFGDYGAEGVMTHASQAIEAELTRFGDTRLMNEFLQLRQYQNDYLLGREGSYPVIQFNIGVPPLRAAFVTLPDPTRSTLLKDLDRYVGAVQSYVKLQKEIGLTDHDGLQRAMRDSIHQVEPLVSTIVEETKKLSQSQSAYLDMLISIIVVVALGVIAGGIVFSLFARSISSPVGAMVGVLRRLAEGDLTVGVNSKIYERKDEIGVLAMALEDTSVRLRQMVTMIQESSEQVAASSEQISGSAQTLADGALSQASTLEETSAAVEELTASVDQVSENARSQALAVEQGSHSMSQVKQSIDEISRSLLDISELTGKSVANSQDGADAVEKVVNGINLIAKSSEKIAGIITVIADIADQTNLLALNASIEAARAGEHGRGFAVVADEVSRLAERSTASTKEIEELIRESVRSVEEGVQTAKGSQLAMEQIRAASQTVNGTIGGLSESMKQQVAAVQELAGALENINEMSQNISAATEEQTSNAKQVAKAVENVNELTQAAAAAAEETSSSTHGLTGMAQQLQTLVSQFSVASERAKRAISAPRKPVQNNSQAAPIEAASEGEPSRA